MIFLFGYCIGQTIGIILMCILYLFGNKQKYKERRKLTPYESWIYYYGAVAGLVAVTFTALLFLILLQIFMLLV